MPLAVALAPAARPGRADSGPLSAASGCLRLSLILAQAASAFKFVHGGDAGDQPTTGSASGDSDSESPAGARRRRAVFGL